MYAEYLIADYEGPALYKLRIEHNTTLVKVLDDSDEELDICSVKMEYDRITGNHFCVIVLPGDIEIHGTIANMEIKSDDNG